MTNVTVATSCRCGWHSPPHPFTPFMVWWASREFDLHFLQHLFAFDAKDWVVTLTVTGLMLFVGYLFWMLR